MAKRRSIHLTLISLPTSMRSRTSRCRICMDGRVLFYLIMFNDKDGHGIEGQQCRDSET
jgi:hypothetical protein